MIYSRIIFNTKRTFNAVVDDNYADFYWHNEMKGGKKYPRGLEKNPSDKYGLVLPFYPETPLSLQFQQLAGRF